MDKIKIPTYSENRLFNNLDDKELIFTEDVNKVKDILSKIKERFYDRTKTVKIINNILDNDEILNKCVLVDQFWGAIGYMTFVAEICPLRDHEQTYIGVIHESSNYRDIYKDWLDKNKGKDVFDFIKNNDVERIFIHVNSNTSYRIHLPDYGFLSLSNYEPKHDPEYSDIKFIQDLFK